MDLKKIKPGQWLIVEGDTQSANLFRLIKGKVGIFKEGEKITSIDVVNGNRPKMIGFIATLSAERKHTASVKTESEVEVEIIDANHLRGILQYDIPNNLREDIKSMINTIILSTKIISLQKKLSNIPRVAPEIPKEIDPGIIAILTDLSDLYENSINDIERLMPAPMPVET